MSVRSWAKRVRSMASSVASGSLFGCTATKTSQSSHAFQLDWADSVVLDLNLCLIDHLHLRGVYQSPFAFFPLCLTLVLFLCLELKLENAEGVVHRSS